jgi:hypothetical protein
MTLDLAQKQEWMKKFTSSAIFEKLNSLSAKTRGSNCQGDYAEKWQHTSDIFILYLQSPVSKYCLSFTDTADFLSDSRTYAEGTGSEVNDVT